MAVMAIGLLGVAGLQATLRSNADIARQRAEAVRIAQAEVERWRAFTVLTLPSPAPVPPAPAHSVAFNDLQSGSDTVAGTNASYTLTRTVSAMTGTVARNVVVTVGWADRTGANQNVTLSTQIAGILPEVAGSLILAPKSLTNSQLRGRHSAVPATATDQGNGTSTFVPPGGGGTQWVFSNNTGLITSICNPTCVAANYALLSGYLRFALPSNGSGDPTQPSSSDSENPTSNVPSSQNFRIRVNATAPSTTSVACATDVRTAYIAYYCAMPLSTSAAPYIWSGTPELHGFSIASDRGDDNDNEFKVCRYTPNPNSDTTNNPIDHPKTYTNVTVSLNNQNYLIIRAGDDHDSFVCPTDNASTPALDGDTRLHQPAP